MILRPSTARVIEVRADARDEAQAANMGWKWKW